MSSIEIWYSRMGSWMPCRSQLQKHREQRRIPALRTAKPTPRTTTTTKHRTPINQSILNQTESSVRNEYGMRAQAATWSRSVPCRCAGRGGRRRAPGRACRCPTPARRSRGAATIVSTTKSNRLELQRIA
jgi:hypothetical protein